MGLIEFPDEMDDAAIQHAIETEILSPRNTIAARGAAPEQPQPEQPGAVRRFFQGAGIPTSPEEAEAAGRHLSYAGVGDSLKEGDTVGAGVHALTGPLGTAALDLFRTIGREGGEQGGKALAAFQAGDYENALKHALGAAVPFLGPPAAEGNIAGAAGRAASVLGPEALRAGPVNSALGGALDASVNATSRKVFNPAGDAPALAESIGSQLAAKGQVMSNPRAELGEAFGGHPEQRVQAFKNRAAQESQLAELEKKYPNADVSQQADEMVVKEPGSIDQQRADFLAKGAQRPTPLMSHAVGELASAAAAGGVATAFGGPAVGAGVGAAVKAAFLAKKIMTNPLARTFSNVVKSKISSAIKSGDVGTLSSIAGKVLGSETFDDDEYGHDTAVRDVVNQAMDQSQGDPKIANQILAGKEIVFESPDGTTIALPYHVQQAFRTQIGRHVSDNR